jgi:hypothetical protein
MEKKKFSIPEKYAVWKVLGPNCKWCKTPVEYADCHIDHIIPEKLLDDEEQRKIVLKQYGLDESFEINSFENWIPVHPSCNLTKQGQVIEGAPIFLELLSNVKKNVPKTLEIFNKWENQNKTAKLTTVIEREAAKGSIDKTTVTRIFAGINDDLTPIMGLTGSTIDNRVFYVPSNDIWQVTGSENGFYTLSKDAMIGISPIDPSLDSKWLCTNCKNYGPWDGNTCLSCGKYSYD